MLKRALCATVSVCAFAMVMNSAAAQDATAPSEAESESRMLNTVTVTATRREESIQDTGASVSALDNDALRARSVQSVEDVADLVPGLQVSSYQGDTSIFIRGIGTPVIVAGADSSTATYLDGVYLSRAAAIGPGFFYVERIEVLRGPQGTLYGRNATGGAVNIITKRPTDEFSGDARLIVGNFDRMQVFAALSGPLNDAVRARLAVQKEDRSGFTTVHLPRGALPPSQPDRTFDAEDKHDVTARATVEFDLAPTVMLTLTGDYYEADDRANVFHFASLGYQEEVPGWLASREGSQTLPYFGIKNSGRVSAPGSRDIYSAVDYFNTTTVWGLTGRLDWALGDHDVQIITGYKNSNPDFQNSFDLGDTFNTYIHRAEDHEQWNADFQISSPSNARFSWIAGGGYFSEENAIQNNIFGDFWEPILTQGLLDLQTAGVLPPFPVNIPESTLCCELHLNGRQETEAFNIFIDTSFDLTDTLTLKAGVRYSEEERDGFQNFDLAFLPAMPGGALIRFAPEILFFPNAVSDSRDGVQPDPFGFVVAPVEGPATFDATTPKVALEWAPADDLLLYASAQRGFKSGGYNIGSSQRTPYEPEEIWAYEGGVKAGLLDNRFRLNAAAFMYDYTNLQAQDSIANQPIIRNVGKAEVKGAELEFAALLSDMFQIDGSVTYLDAVFTEGELTEPLRPAPLTQAPGSVLRNLAGLRLPRAPEWKMNIGAQADFAAFGGDVTLRADYAWQDEIFFTVFNISAASQDSYGVVRARATYAPAGGRYQVALFGENLSDESYFTNQILTGTTYGAEFVGSLGAPRTYGIELSTRF
ncbi:TonB-dependent receptor [Hyphomonas sp.]|uniref:TonB-dependent receptor n=1 Tax=Hyphomonas sp. TaxID=87 RepID=UPI003F72AAC8